MKTLRDRLLKYFDITEDTDLHSALLTNEHKHLSHEYRSNTEKMSDLLHSKFFEKGKSGKEYDKNAILESMPLKSVPCIVSEFTFNIYGETLECDYILNEDNVMMKCKSFWMFEEEKLRLRLFQSSFINTE